MFSNYEIVDTLARQRFVEKIVDKYVTPNKDDLVQYVYMCLFEMDNDKLNELYTNKQLNFFTSRIISNQVLSLYSKHYRENKAAGLPQLQEEKLYESTKDYVFDDSNPHELDEKVDAFLDTLKPYEKEMLLIQMQKCDLRAADIDLIKRKYGISDKEYKNQLPQLKKRLWNWLKGTPEETKVRLKKLRRQNDSTVKSKPSLLYKDMQIFKKHFKKNDTGKYNIPVIMVDRNGKIVRRFNSPKEAAEILKPEGYDIKSIYKCLNGASIKHRKHFFFYE